MALIDTIPLNVRGAFLSFLPIKNSPKWASFHAQTKHNINYDLADLLDRLGGLGSVW